MMNIDFRHDGQVLRTNNVTLMVRMVRRDWNILDLGAVGFNIVDIEQDFHVYM